MIVRAIIQARMLSQRFRGKSLIAVHGIPLLYRVVNSVKKLDFIDEICIATTDTDADNPIEAAARDMKVKIFRGSALDVLNRFAECSRDLSEKDVIVRFTADNPLNYPQASLKAFELHINGKFDYTHIDGLSHICPEFIGVEALREADRLTNSNFDREHVSPFFRKNNSIFKINTLPSNFNGLRSDLDKHLTIDTYDDMLMFEKMLDVLEYDKKEIEIEYIYDYLTKNVLHLPRNTDSKNPSINFDGTIVGEGFPSYIIAEIGQNHNGDVNIARKLIDMAVRCGANAVKFQKRDIPSELTKEAFDKPYDNPNSFGKTYGEHRIFLELNEKQHLELKEYSDAVGITYFCTPCDVPSVELLERINCPFYKVASRDLTNIPLLEKLGQTGKPVIISTGMANLQDIDDALTALGKGPESVVIMQCTSEYPCKVENVNLKAMYTLRDKYKCLVGLSDHTSGIVISTAAAVMGATMIEKHITLDRTMKGTDQPGSLEEAGLKKLIQYIRSTELAMGDGVKDVNPATKAAKEKLARSVTSKVNIPAGTLLTESMLTLKSPGTGLKWNERGKLLDKKAKKNILADTTLSSEDFE